MYSAIALNRKTRRGEIDLKNRTWKKKKVNEKDFFEQNKEKAGNGSAEAQYNLGCCYQYGRGVEMNKEQAIMWYTKAIENGYGKAKLNLGLCYISNLFTMETGYEWIRVMTTLKIM